MSQLMFTYSGVSKPSLHPRKQRGNNALADGKNVHPQSFYPSANSGFYSNLRRLNLRQGGSVSNKVGVADSSSYILQRKIKAQGKSINYSGPQSFSGVDRNQVRRRLRATRSGGAVAPPKKYNKHLL